MTRRPPRAGGGFRGRVAVAFVAPFYVLFSVFFVIPIGALCYLSLTSWSGFGAPHFIGFANYTGLVHDPVMAQVLPNMAVYVFGSLGVAFGVSLPLALALSSQTLWGRSVVRFLFFSPVVAPTAGVAIVFNVLFNSSGPVNSVLRTIGIGPVNWLGSERVAAYSILIVVVWQSIGFTAMYFMAGLGNIPPDLYEAAALDGAGRWRSAWSITLPMLKSMSLFVAITVFIGASQIFDDPTIITKGGPGNSSMSYLQYLYTQGFSYLHLGVASAMGVVLAAVVGTISWAQYRRMAREA